ncbi:hypothetical protein J2Z79_001541 [Symbiobacterium terraclitae]|uniref:Uncharacterized protein n=1 Tax=Symbiobacterium terraclitae TaxID=557451 RepID=A0ABS4JRI7_9FIRM|nr:hypothetical protein [Symbiobacterium terraclitae]MBP2018142.1 hypothetical protein [Symbiobacterium terraclitae]
MRRWGTHLTAICGGLASVWAAGLVWPLVLDERTNTFSWGYFAVSRALLALAGFLLLAPLVWQRPRGHHRVALHWGLLAVYGVVGVILAAAHPLTMLLVTNGAGALGRLLGQLALAPFLSAFGAVLVGAGTAHAFGRPEAE